MLGSIPRVSNETPLSPVVGELDLKSCGFIALSVRIRLVSVLPAEAVLLEDCTPNASALETAQNIAFLLLLVWIVAVQQHAL